MRGSQRPKGQMSAFVRRRYDLEIQEMPVRNWQQARELLELTEYCYEARHCLNYITRDVFCSSDGDDRGWRMAETLDDLKTKVHPDVLSIGKNLAERKQGDDYVLGGDRLKKASGQVYGLGDSFLQFNIEKEGIGRNDYGISRTLYMPVFEMFRIESDTGYLEGFEQRSMLDDQSAVKFEPPSMMQMSYDRNYLYGRSAFIPSIEGYNAWTKAKDTAADLADAIRSVGTNPNIHIMQEGATPAQKKEYKEDHRLATQEGIITDLCLMNGQDVKKMANINPNIDPLIEAFLQWRYLLIPAGFPTHFFPGLDARQKGAKEIAGVPALSYQRLIWDIRSILTKGIVRAIDTEIILAKGMEFYREYGRYRIEWAQWNAVAHQSSPEKDVKNKESNGKVSVGVN